MNYSKTGPRGTYDKPLADVRSYLVRGGFIASTEAERLAAKKALMTLRQLSKAAAVDGGISAQVRKPRLSPSKERTNDDKKKKGARVKRLQAKPLEVVQGTPDPPFLTKEVLFCEHGCGLISSVENHRKFCLHLLRQARGVKTAEARMAYILPPPIDNLQNLELLRAGESFSQAFRRNYRHLPDAFHRKCTFRSNELNGVCTEYRFGKLALQGYVVFFFHQCRSVAVESPRDVDATYILSSRWLEMVNLSKREIRDEYPRDHRRILHTSKGWLERVKEALYREWYR